MEKTDIRTMFRTPFMTMVRNILLAYVCFMLCRLAFLWYNWDDVRVGLDSSMTGQLLKGSLLYDTSGLMYLCIPYIAMMMFPLHFKEKDGYYKIVRNNTNFHI